MRGAKQKKTEREREKKGFVPEDVTKTFVTKTFVTKTFVTKTFVTAEGGILPTAENGPPE